MSVSEKGVAFVTGGAQGLGKAIALRLCADGFDVAVNDVPSNKANLAATVEEIKAKGRRSHAVLGDVSKEEDVKNMIASVVKELGSLDVMVANAGIARGFTNVVDTTVEEWDKHYDVNVKGTFLTYKHATIQMLAQGRGGRIIGACSLVGKKGAATFGTYSSTKFAVRGLTQSLALEVAKDKITVNAYAPGTILTPGMRTLDGRFGEQMGTDKGVYLDMMLKEIPAGHLGDATDIANVVSFLASKESHYITGQSIQVNGGMAFD